MLVLSRTFGESIVITTPAGVVTVTVVAMSNGRVRLGIVAPREVACHRSEVTEAIAARELGGEG